MDVGTGIAVGAGIATGVLTIIQGAIKLIPYVRNGRNGHSPDNEPATRRELATVEARVVHTDVCTVARGELNQRMVDMQASMSEHGRNMRALMRHFQVQPPEKEE